MCKYTNYPSYSLSYLFLHNPFSPLLAAFSCISSSYTSAPPSSSSSSYSSFLLLLILLRLQLFIGLDLSTRSFQTLLFLTICLQFLSFSFFKSHLHLFFCRRLVLIPIWFQSTILLTSSISYIQFRCPHRYILHVFTCLTSLSPCINFCIPLVLFILHPSFFPVMTLLLLYLNDLILYPVYACAVGKAI